MLVTTEQAIARIHEDGYTVDESTDLDALAHELADSEMPAYYSDIISEWKRLDTQDTDVWHDQAVITKNTTICDLMQIDLYEYYLNLFLGALDKMTEGAN